MSWGLGGSQHGPLLSDQSRAANRETSILICKPFGPGRFIIRPKMKTQKVKRSALGKSDFGGHCFEPPRPCWSWQNLLFATRPPNTGRPVLRRTQVDVQPLLRCLVFCSFLQAVEAPTGFSKSQLAISNLRNENCRLWSEALRWANSRAYHGPLSHKTSAARW